jgi:hypothetical protein
MLDIQLWLRFPLIMTQADDFTVSAAGENRIPLTHALNASTSIQAS